MVFYFYNTNIHAQCQVHMTDMLLICKQVNNLDAYAITLPFCCNFLPRYLHCKDQL